MAYHISFGIAGDHGRNYICSWEVRCRTCALYHWVRKAGAEPEADCSSDHIAADETVSSSVARNTGHAGSGTNRFIALIRQKEGAIGGCVVLFSRTHDWFEHSPSIRRYLYDAWELSSICRPRAPATNRYDIPSCLPVPLPSLAGGWRVPVIPPVSYDILTLGSSP